MYRASNDTSQILSGSTLSNQEFLLLYFHMSADLEVYQKKKSRLIYLISPRATKNLLLVLSDNVPISSILANPRSLKHLCRLKIRKCMGRLHLRCPVFMSFLPLPNRLKAYVLYKEYDLYGQGIVTGSW